MKRHSKEIRKQLSELRRVAAKMPSPLAGMSLEEAIRKMRKTREELWEEKFAVRP